MPKIDISKARIRKGANLPAPLHETAIGRIKHVLGEAGGLTDYGVNLVKLPPEGWSAQRHWHSKEDEFIYILEGEVVLVTDKGEDVLKPGDCAAFAKNVPDGHHLINKSGATAIYLEIGSRVPGDMPTYPDADLMPDFANGRYLHKDGTPYPKRSDQ
jgi:uncharacterized cupin superfamily protein